jgi:DivIVA domain-containing protein
MGVDQTSLDRIRNATFPTTRRGYDKHEVEKFLSRLADWLETGAGDESRSDVVKRELEKVGERTGAILAQAEESAQQIRAEAEEEARGTVNTANMEAAETRTEADNYARETRTSADSYAQQTRQAADEVLATAEAKAQAQTREKLEGAQAQARRIVEEGLQRREDIEAVIADLVRRRDDVLADTQELTGKLTAAVSQHRATPGQDAFERPEELDPLAREGAEEEPGPEPADEGPGTEETQRVEAEPQPEETRLVDAEPQPEPKPESVDEDTAERPVQEPPPEHRADLRT